MEGVTASTRVRMPASERREQVIAIALRHFAAGGYHGTSTEAIAAEVGLSQPYLFRLFRTKRDLFLACCDACNQRIGSQLIPAAQAAPEGEKLTAMGGAYMDLLADEHLLRFQLQMYAACSDDVIRAAVRDGWRRLVMEVRGVTTAPEAELWRFFATGMMLNVVATIGLHEIAAEDPWAAAWIDPKSLLDEPLC